VEMLAYFDDAPLPLARPTFAAAVQAAQQQAEQSGRIVAQVLLDGTPVAAAILSSPPEVALGREVRFVTGAAPAAQESAVTSRRLGEALQSLRHAAEQQAAAAKLVRTARVDEALAPLSQAVQAWHAVQRTAVEELTWASESEAFQAIIEDLSATLRELHRSLEQQDWSALGDVLAHDMKEQAEGWRVLLEGITRSGAAPEPQH
jgi:hypothetical protein